jgi:hypothetical protein
MPAVDDCVRLPDGLWITWLETLRLDSVVAGVPAIHRRRSCGGQRTACRRMRSRAVSTKAGVAERGRTE